MFVKKAGIGLFGTKNHTFFLIVLPKQLCSGEFNKGTRNVAFL